MSIVHVVAVISAKQGKRSEVLKLFHANVPNVLAEDGCIEYLPTIDAKEAGGLQTKIGPDSFIVIEKWESLEHLKAHATAAHMKEYAFKVKDLLVDRTIHVLAPA
tara:strand:+ start:253 stop:567 length:315 start_codon:yes stop_codon:yes gene_type:complete